MGGDKGQRLKCGAMVVIVVLSLIAVSASADEELPFGVRFYGSYKKILESRTPAGIVGLEQAAAPHTYAVGEIRNARGELTVYNGEVFLNYGEDGIDTSKSEIPAGEQAMVLVTAHVEKWREIVIPKNMSEGELYLFLLEQARKSGLNIKVPFPFLVEGEVTGLVWHVLNGAEVEQAGHDKQLYFTKLVEYRDHASVALIGFCSENHYGFTPPGELWHAHVIFKREKTAGHIDAFSVLKGAKLFIPVKQDNGEPEEHHGPLHPK